MEASRLVRESTASLTESLKDVVTRFRPYWDEVITPAIRQGQRVLIVAHGNSLRGLVKHLDHISDEKIVELNIPTGIPLVYELDDDLQSFRSYYLRSPGTTEQAPVMSKNLLLIDGPDANKK